MSQHTRPGLWLLIVVVGLNGLGQIVADVYLPSLPNMVDDFQATPEALQYSIAWFMLGFTSSQLFFGPLSDGIGRKGPLMAGLLLCCLGTILCITAESLSLLLWGRLLQGIGVGAPTTLARSIMRDILSGPNLSKYGSYMAIVAIFLLASSPLIGGYIEHHLSWRWNFGFMLVLVAFIALNCAIAVPETNQHRSMHHLHPSQMMQNIRLICRHKTFLFYTFSSFSAYAAIVCWLTAGPFLLQDKMGLSPIDYGWVYAATSMGFIAASLFNGRCVVRLGIDRMLHIGLWSLCLSGLALILLSHWQNPWFIAAPVAVLLFGAGLVFPNASAGGLETFSEIAGTAGALFGASRILGGVFASTIIALLPETSTRPMGICIAVATGAPLVIRPLMMRQLK